ncbi:hypothetical protein JHK87_025948 [Glycine soja]|nr:hypothetical protein JHK87_025948 [Glycine soja]
MDLNEQQIDIKVYSNNATPAPEHETLNPSSNPPQPKKCRALMAKGIQKIYQKPPSSPSRWSSPPSTRMVNFPWHRLLWLRHPAMAFPEDDRFKVGFIDFVHAVMSVTVFVAISISDYRVTNCLPPWEGEGYGASEGEFPFNGRDCLHRFVSHLPYFQTWDWLDVC